MEMRCVQGVDRDGMNCQCSRRAVWFVTTSTTRGVCTQHRRYMDDRPSENVWRIRWNCPLDSA